MIHVFPFLLSWALPPAHALQTESLLALRSGDCRPALREEGEHPPAHLLALGRCQLMDGRPETALATLAPLTATELSDYGALVSAEALMVLDRPKSAAAVLADVQLPGEAGRTAALLRGQALVESGAYLKARDTLRPLLTESAARPGAATPPGGPDPAEIRWWLAEGAHRRGDTDAAVPVWLSIWARNPSSALAEQASERLASAGRHVPDPTTADGRDLIEVRIRALERAQQWKEALSLRDTLPPDGPSTSTSAMARASFRARDYKRAVALYSSIASPSPEQRFDLALAASRTGDYALAARHYAELQRRHPSHALGIFADFKIAYLEYDAGNLSAAVTSFSEHLARYPSSKRADEARWFRAWSLYRLGRMGDADTAFQELLERHPSSGLAPAARYWQARIDAKAGRDAEARAGYEEVLRRWPISGHAWFASWRLGRRFTGQPAVPQPAVPSSLDVPAFRRGAALADAGLSAWARAELTKVSASDQPAKWSLAHARILAGDYTGAKKLVRCPTPTRVPQLPPDQRAVCLAQPTGESAIGQASAGGIPGNLPFAIMTAESALRPEVSSPAGARGLMQLMPSLAESLHPQRFGDAPFHPDLLFEPGYNAALGVDELVSLNRRFADAGIQPNLPLVIAGYNAGEDAVRRWLDAYETPPEPDRFAEDIGYTETRRYVRRVLGYLQSYRMAYGDQ